MYELIKSILDAIINLTPNAMASRRESKQRALGARIFAIYLDSYEILWRGDRIVEILQKARAGYSGGIRSREFDELLHGQAAAISQLNDNIFEYGRCLTALAPEAFGELKRHITAGKWQRITALMDLVEILNTGVLPQRAERIEDEQPRPVHGIGNIRQRQFSLLIPPTIQWEELPRLDSLRDGPELSNLIDAYLRETNPSRELQAAKEALMGIREELDNHFSVSDILLELAQQRQHRRH
ncbi:hypothetical protein ACWD5R_42255 [Streptomyces sp. NPDC002514]|uniref:hypothetical protein n=1 Tax=Streptomyces sp. NPDC001270 TaxID=3364554 RepID=UPI00368B979E